ncbi:caspase family protein [Streptomyces sp. NPDC059696]|uniref:caspase family protein n=1 Tax=Streptomyces sp. NPDC059696 TaxID=3346911 RepID=UPI0036848D31
MTRTDGHGRPTGPGRRFLIAIGCSRYDDAGTADLPGVPDDVGRVCSLLEPMGYVRVLAEASLDPPAHEVARVIDRWANQADLGEDDIVVLYFAGHGVRGEDRHYLLCANSEPGLWSTALATEDLARPLVNSALGHLLVILDTCYAGAGIGEIAVHAHELSRIRRGTAGRCLLAAARGKETAAENVFVEALAEALTRPRAGAYQEFIGVRETTERVNEYLRLRQARQHARHAVVDSDGQDPFFRNPAHVPGLPVDELDVATLDRLRRSQHGHFDPRGRGVEHAGEKGDHFKGRERALSELVRFLSGGRHDRKARVVTGSPGSGKSALLGRLWALSAPDRPERPTDGSHPCRPALQVIPLHARRATARTLVTDLSGALGLAHPDRDDVLRALGERERPIAVLLDALDEAGTAGDATEGARIARELLQPLSVLPAVRLVVGTRRPLIRALGRAVEVIDLDRPAYMAPDDISAYARSLLLDEHDPESLSPYRGREALATTVAGGIAARAGRSYLVARMTARALVHGQITVDPARPGWQDALPSDADQAFAAYLDRFGPHRVRVERLLRPLAYAQGAGLPWSTVWAPVAEALSGVPCPQEDLQWLHEHAGAYIVEAATPAGSVFRLFHETMAEYLRRPGGDADAHRAIGNALSTLAGASGALSAEPDWSAAPDYVREHLATHAAAGGMLDALLDDPGFLVHAAPAPLLRALESVTTGEGHRIARIYRTSAAVHARADDRARRQILSVDAARHEDLRLAGRLSADDPWQVTWATGALVSSAHRATLKGHEELVQQVSCIEADGRPVAVSVGHDGVVVKWDLLDRQETDRTHLESDWLSSVHCVRFDGRPHAFVGTAHHTVEILSLDDLSVRGTLLGHEGFVTEIAHYEHRGALRLVTASRDGSVRVWDPLRREEVAVLDGHGHHVSAVRCLSYDRTPHALTGSWDGTVRLWNLVDLSVTAAFELDDPVNAVDYCYVDGRLKVLVAPGEWGTVEMWDPFSGQRTTALFGSEAGESDSLAHCAIGGVPYVIVGGGDGVMRLLDLTGRAEAAEVTGHTYAVTSIACVDLDDRPHAVTASSDDTVRIWDLAEALTTERRGGHTDWVDNVRLVESEEGRLQALSASRDHTVRTWDTDSGAETGRLPNRIGWPHSITLLTVGGRTHVGIGHTDGALLWDLRDGTDSVAFRPTEVGQAGYLEVRGNHYAVLSTASGAAEIWDVSKREKLWVASTATSWTCTAVIDSAGPRPLLLIGTRTGRVEVWDFDARTPLATLEGHEDHISSLVVAPVHGRPHLLTGSWDGTIGVWDLPGLTLRTFLRDHDERVTTISAFTAHGRSYAVTGGWDRTLLTWDLETLRVADRLRLPLEVESSDVRDGLLLVGAKNELIALRGPLFIK